MRDTIFRPNNPNHDIFIVETEEGPDAEDNMCSMIGDATMRHLSELTPAQRQAWEYYVLTGGENLFHFMPSPADVDQDPYNLKIEDLEHYFEHNQVSEGMKVHLEEAIEVERERREKSQDAYDRATELIPFQEWEENPGLFSHYDLPTTPKNIALFAGNTSQLFYDYFPEGHPDAGLLNQYLRMMDREEDKLTKRYGDFVLNWLSQQAFREQYTYRVLVKLTQYLVEGEKDYEEITIKALQLIDEDWRKVYVTKARSKEEADPMLKLLRHKQTEWEGLYDQGVSILPLVKQFGQLLFTNFRKKLKKHHWALYRSIKEQYMPAVIVRGLDVNRCRLGDMERALQVPRQIAVAIFCNRPYQTVGELLERQVEEKARVFKDKEGKEWAVSEARTVKKGWLKPEGLQEKGDIEAVYELIREKAEEAQAKRTLKVLSDLSRELIARQKAAKDNFTSREWSSVWALYRSTKNDILGAMKEGTPNE